MVKKLKQIDIYFGIKLHIPDRLIIDFKEGLIFALLGVLKINDQINFCLL